MIPAGLVSGIVGWWVDRRMTALHQAKLEELGGSIRGQAIIGFDRSRRWTHFYMGEQYQDLGDEKLSRVCNLMRIFNKVFFSLLAFGAVLIGYLYIQAMRSS